jgi:hypothetical protein
MISVVNDIIFFFFMWVGRRLDLHGHENLVTQILMSV